MRPAFNHPGTPPGSAKSLKMVCESNRGPYIVLFVGSLAIASCSGPRPGWERTKVNGGEAGVSLGGANVPFLMKLGDVPAGSSHTTPIRLTNGTSNPIRIDGFHATCECTSVVGLPVEVPVGGTKELRITTDFSKEPDFTGGLAITVELRSGIDVKGIVVVDCDVAKPIPKNTIAKDTGA